MPGLPAEYEQAASPNLWEQLAGFFVTRQPVVAISGGPVFREYARDLSLLYNPLDLGTLDLKLCKHSPLPQPKGSK
jgi:hypothetical protein